MLSHRIVVDCWRLSLFEMLFFMVLVFVYIFSLLLIISSHSLFLLLIVNKKEKFGKFSVIIITRHWTGKIHIQLALDDGTAPRIHTLSTPLGKILLSHCIVSLCVRMMNIFTKKKIKWKCGKLRKIKLKNENKFHSMFFLRF